MRITKEESEQNRHRLIEAAGHLFRERGIDGVGVADICKRAGLTHGALYAHFQSKEELAGEALAEGLARSRSKLERVVSGQNGNLRQYLESYLSPRHRDDVAEGCVMAALSSEVPRHGKALNQTFTEGLSKMVAAVESLLKGVGKRDKHRLALAISSSMIGALIAARSTAKTDPELSNAILDSTREALIALAKTPEAALTNHGET
jgi:TetR/AcrR family transcriptional regulator, transcriptional repressor for nem operon